MAEDISQRRNCQIHNGKTKKTLKQQIICTFVLDFTKKLVILHPVWNKYQKGNKKFR